MVEYVSLSWLKVDWTLARSRARMMRLTDGTLFSGPPGSLRRMRQSNQPGLHAWGIVIQMSDRESEGLEQVKNELLAREPIFHKPEFGTRAEDYQAMTAEDYWEVGASGRIYVRDLVVSGLVSRGKVAGDEDWVVSDEKVRRLSDDTYAFTYQLDQAGRLTRRLTLWRHTESGWVILYHQGTIIQDLISDPAGLIGAESDHARKSAALALKPDDGTT